MTNFFYASFQSSTDYIKKNWSAETQKTADFCTKELYTD